MTKRLTNLPPPTTLEELAETCERHAKNYRMNIYDCADCQDCSDTEVAQYQMNVAQWTELAGDIKAMIEAEKPKKTEPVYAWECNECGSQEYTMCVSESDVQNLGCGRCGGDEWHKAIARD